MGHACPINGVRLSFPDESGQNDCYWVFPLKCLLTWPMTLKSIGLILHMDGSRMAGRAGAGVCGLRPDKRLSFSVFAHATVFQAETFAILSKSPT